MGDHMLYTPKWSSIQFLATILDSGTKKDCAPWTIRQHHVFSLNCAFVGIAVLLGLLAKILTPQ